MAWYKEWFGAEYLELYSHRDEGEAEGHVALLERLFGDRRPRAILDLAFAAGAFDWVLNFFTSFGYFEAERENFRVLEEVVRVLAPHGGFLIDLMNLDATLANLKEYERREEAGRRVEIHRSWDAANRRFN